MPQVSSSKKREPQCRWKEASGKVNCDRGSIILIRFERHSSSQTTATPPALEVQEICDYICNFLHQSPTDLRASSLVSPMFTSSAQHHLFHVMDLTSGGWYTSQSTRATRLCRILHNSPHLIRFIRRLSINFEQDGLVLVQVHLTHVETIVLGTSLTTCPPNSALHLAL